MFAAPRVRVICVGPVMKILVIDDDERMRRLIERTLSQGGYQVVAAAEGETGRSPGAGRRCRAPPLARFRGGVALDR
jgi:CheY-like chemotaxis protein